MSLEDNTPDGLVRFATNELRVDSRIEDPSALRLGSPSGGTLSKISGDRVIFGPNGEVVSRLERTLVMFKDHDPASAGDALKCGAIDIFCALEGRTDDAGMVRAMTITPHEIRTYVPIRQMSGPLEPPPTSLWPASAPVTRGGAGGTGPEWINIYRGYMANDVSRIRNAPASEAQLGLVNEYRTRYGYLDDRGYNWLIATFIIPGVV